ncbi:MAG: hypothetical protein KGY46_05305 [Anaerolineales bacterium]|nr:hypothetical protein [Anaerolineales bacterium]
MDIEIINTDSEQAQADEKATAQAGTYTDDWGSVCQVTEPGVIGEVRIPILEDWSDLATFSPPWDVLRGRDLSHVKCARETSDKFLLSDISARPFERLQFLRGTENLFIDLGYGKSELYQLLEMVHVFYLEDIRGWCESDVDGIFMMDDWGSYQYLLINPTVWREIFKPRYQSVFEAVHSAGWHVWLHSDGHINAIIEDLLELDVDVLNLQQPLVNGIDEIGKRFAGRVCFESTCDIQKTLPFGSPDEIRKESRQLLDKWATSKGGFILSVYENTDDLQLPKENVALMVEIFLKHDPWL